MSEMNDEIFEDLKDAYVLDALSEEERRSFEEYLAAHPERQSEVDELGAVAGLLAFAPQEQEPPPELRRRVMEVVEAEAAPRRESIVGRVVGRFAFLRCANHPQMCTELARRPSHDPLKAFSFRGQG